MTTVATIARAMGLDPKSARSKLRRAGIASNHIQSRKHEELVVEVLKGNLKEAARVALDQR